MVPIGVVGELYIGGSGLARGYLNRPDLTQDRFIPHPFKEGERVYRTGDLVRYLPDGNLEYVGRIDHQVKIRGFRIELGEIEATLQRHTLVNEVIVMVQEDYPGDPRLIAYVVGDGDAQKWRDYLKDQLPNYMIPAYFVGLNAFPLTPNGKIDRKALPAPPETGDSKWLYCSSYVYGKTIVSIWHEVLGMENIGIQDSFLKLVAIHYSLRKLFPILKRLLESRYHCMIYLCFIRCSNWQNRLINCSITKSRNAE